MEKDDEVYGEGNLYNTMFRQYDARLARWLSIDPITAAYPHYSPYSAYNNNPVYFNDPLGLAGESPTKDHKVEKGETLTGLAKEHGVSENDIIRANGGIEKWRNDPRRSGDKKNWIYEGETLVIPNLKKGPIYSDVPTTTYVNGDGEVLAKINNADMGYLHNWMTPDNVKVLSDEDIEKGGFFAYIYEDNGPGGHALLMNMDNGDIYEANHPTVNGEVVHGLSNSLDGGVKSQVYKLNFYNQEFWEGVKQERGTMNFHILWVPDKKALLDHVEGLVGQSFDYEFTSRNCKNFVLDLLRVGGATGEAHMMQMYDRTGKPFFTRPASIHTDFDYRIYNIYTD